MKPNTFLATCFLVIASIFCGLSGYSATFMSNQHPQPQHKTAWDLEFFKPIPAGATYTNVHISGDAGTTGVYYGANNAFYDAGWVVYTSNSDPTISVFTPVDFSHRCNGSASGTTTHFPASVNSTNFPDLVDPAGGATTPNNPMIIYNTSTGSTLTLNGAAVPATATKVCGYEVSGKSSTHGGTHLSGGEISSDEWSNGINHAVSLEIYAWKYLSPNDGGWRFPGWTSDGYAENGSVAPGYNGTIAALRIGARMAIPTSYNCGLVTAGSARTLCRALQEYGAILTDDPAWDSISIGGNELDQSGGSSVMSTFPSQADVATLLAQLQQVVFPSTTVQLTSGTSWTAPAGVYHILVQLWGGGAGASSSATLHGGGGAGGYVKCTQVVVPGTAYAYAIGAGGGPGVAGGNTTWTGGTCLAPGGATTTTATGGAGGHGNTSPALGDWGVDGGKGGNGATAGGSGGGSADPEATNGTTALNGPTGNNASGSTPGSATTGGKGNGGAGGLAGGSNGSSYGAGGGARGSSGTSGSGANGEIDITYEN